MEKEHRIVLYEESMFNRFSQNSGTYDVEVGASCQLRGRVGGSDETTVLLRRGYEPSKVYSVIANIREKIPGNAIKIKVDARNVKADLGDIEVDSLAEMNLRRNLRRAA